MTAHSFEGGCHCGNLSCIFETSAPLDNLGLRVCLCSFCRKHGQRSASDPEGRMRISVRDLSKLNRYRFALNTTDFLICEICGVYVGAVLSDKSGAWMVVNVNTLHDLPVVDFPVAAHDWDSEDTETRIARRKKAWTPLVEFRENAA